MRKIFILLALCLIVSGCDEKGEIKEKDITFEEAQSIMAEIDVATDYSHEDEKYYYFLIIGESNDVNSNEDSVKYYVVNKKTGDTFNLAKVDLERNVGPQVSE